MSNATTQQVPNDDPRMIAWEAFKAPPDYEDAKRWTTAPGGDGALWWAFIAGFNAAQSVSA